MAAVESWYSALLLSILWLLGLDFNLFLLVLVPSIAVNAACITSCLSSSADYGVVSPADSDSIFTSSSVSDNAVPDSLVTEDSHRRISRAVLPTSSASSDQLPAVLMTPFSILPIIAYTALALLLSYLGLRLLRRFNIRLLPAFLSSDGERIPQPVTSASGKSWVFGKGWSWSLNVFRRSFKGPNATPTIKSRPKPADLDLQEVELLPTNSRSKEGQLIDISSSSTASAITGIKLGVYPDSSNVGSADSEQSRPQLLQKDIGDVRHLSRSSSVDGFPQFSSSPNPFSAFDTPLKSHHFPPTPPLTNSSSTLTYPSPFTPPSLSSLQLHTPSPSTAMSHVVTASKPLNPFRSSIFGTPRSPSPSLSTSPLSKHRRSRSLGGISLKRLGSSVKGKGVQNDEILVDYSSSGSSSLESASDPPTSSLTSSDVGTQRILPEPITLSHSRSENSYLYGPLVPHPVPLLDFDMPEQPSLPSSRPLGTPTVWAFDVDVEDQRTDAVIGKLVDIDNDEPRVEDRDMKDRQLVDVSNDELKVEHIDKLVETKREKHVGKLLDVSEDEDDVPLASVQKALLTPEADKLVDVESAIPEYIHTVPTPPRAPAHTEFEEPKLVDISDHSDIDVEAQQDEHDSWNWDDDLEQDPWAQPVQSSDLISWGEQHGEKESTPAQASVDPISSVQEEVVAAEPVSEPASEQSVEGLDDPQPVLVEEDIESVADSKSAKELTDEAASFIVEKPPVLIVSHEAPTSVVEETSVSAHELPCIKVTFEEATSPDSEIGVCLIPPTPVIHPVNYWDDDDFIPRDVTEKPAIDDSEGNADASSTPREGTPLTTSNDIHDHNDTPIAAPVIELPPLSIPLITISSEVYDPEESESSEDVPDPDLIPLPELSSVHVANSQTPPCEKGESPKEPMSQTPTPPASPPMPVMRSIPSSPRKERENKPAWSLRAADAPALGLASAHSSPTLKAKTSLPMDKDTSTSSPVASSPTASNTLLTVNELSSSLPGSFPEIVTAPPTVPERAVSADTKPIVKGAAMAASTAVVAQPGLRHRMTRSPIDIALAMQLRPGLGVGADPAWMVRFLMTMFGWFAVLLSGRGEF